MIIYISDEQKWNITIDSEREYWNNHIIGKYFNLPTECTNCKNSNIHLIENPALNNPFLM